MAVTAKSGWVVAPGGKGVVRASGNYSGASGSNYSGGGSRGGGSSGGSSRSTPPPPPGPPMVRIVANGKVVTVPETTPGLYGRLGYSYAPGSGPSGGSGGSSSTPAPTSKITPGPGYSVRADQKGVYRTGTKDPSDPTVREAVNEAQDLVDVIVESNLANGNVINEVITVEDLSDMDIAKFLAEAEAEIAPEYRGKFQQAKDALTQKLADVGFDLKRTKEANVRTTDINRRAGQEEIAGRGLAFSGQRNEFEEDTSRALSLAQTASEETARRQRQTAGSAAESQLGTERVRNLGFGNQFKLSEENVLGSLVSERQYVKENLAKEKNRQERERRAYAARGLSFA